MRVIWKLYTSDSGLSIFFAVWRVGNLYFLCEFSVSCRYKTNENAGNFTWWRTRKSPTMARIIQDMLIVRKFDNPRMISSTELFSCLCCYLRGNLQQYRAIGWLSKHKRHWWMAINTLSNIHKTAQNTCKRFR